MSGVVSGKYSKLGRAKPPMHPLGVPFQGDNYVGPGDVIHGYDSDVGDGPPTGAQGIPKGIGTLPSGAPNKANF